MSRPDLYPKPDDISGWMDKTIEECGELLKAIGKYKRFGAVATDDKTGLVYHNGVDVVSECFDVALSINAMVKAMKETPGHS